MGLQPWDTAAGTLLVVEAGGRVGTLAGGDYAHGGHIIAATPRVYDAMVAAIAPHLIDDLRS
jgi:myo-inositol-1(or 4)-monophosphatase